MPYVIAPLGKVKGENNFAPFEEALKSLQDAAIVRAKDVWKGYDQGGLYPGDKQFGICPMRANEMASDVSATTLSGTYSFRKNFGGTGWRPVFNYSTRRGIIHAFAGFAITDEINRVLSLRFELGDKLYPIIDTQEALGWGAFAILFKEDAGRELIAQEETRVLVRAYLDTTGYQRIVPLGFQLYRNRDLVITET